MKFPCGSTCIRTLQIILLVLLVLLLAPSLSYGQSASNDGFGLRNQNPFLQVFGLPILQTADLISADRSDYVVSLDLANHADAGKTDLETFVVDGETYFLTLSARRRVTSWLELGIDAPFISHDDGFMDDGIERWHDIFGMSNTKRRGPSNELDFRYDRGGVTQFELMSSGAGIGDIQLTAAFPLREGGEINGRAVALRSSLKLPTGDEKELRGSGAADLSLALHVSDAFTLMRRELRLSGFAGALLLGEGDVLTALQRDVVPFAGGVAAWRLTERFAAVTQIYLQGSYFDSDIKELGGNSAQLAVGGSLRAKSSDFIFKFAVVEDVSANATTDFALHFSIVGIGGR